jgi:hypothetical protein
MLHKFVSFGLVCVFFVTSPFILLAQQRLMGELTISSAPGEESGPVTINGEVALSGGTVVSPLEIATPAETSATIVVKGVGRLEFGPNSRMNLTFDKGKISGSFTQGSVTILSVRETAFSIETVDGIVSGPYPELDNIINIYFEKGKTKVRTIAGFAAFNGGLIPAGQAAAAAASGGLGLSATALLAIAALLAAAILGTKVAVDASQDEEVVSPVR